MRWRGCPREAEILRSVRLGETARLLEHLQTCAACREAVRIAEFFREDSDVDAQQLPDPGRIYWRALLLQRRALAERATRPILWVQQVALAATAVLVLAAAVALWRVSAGLPRLTQFWASTPSESHVAGAVLLAFATLVIPVAIAWWTARLDDA